MKKLAFLSALAVLATLLVTISGGSRDALALHDMPCEDLNGDGEVAFGDLTIVYSYFGQTVPPAPAQVDMDGDTVVDLFEDILGVAAAMFTTTACQDTPVHGKGSFPGSSGDDVFGSMGQFRVIVEPEFRSLMTSYPGYDGTSRLTSPVMSDAATVIGRSAPHTHGSAGDTGGVSVGSAGTTISDSDFSVEPAGFQGAAGTREVHTEVRTMNMTAGGAAVRAGTEAPSQPISPGEVEAASASGDPADDWPAGSFFNVFVELDLPAAGSFPGGTLYNSQALLVVHTKLEQMPPTVVYIHGNTSAVPVLFKTTNPGFWDADDLFGYLVLAGHGAGFGDTPGATQDLFEDAMEEIETEVGELPLPEPVGGIAGLPSSDASSPVRATDSSQEGKALVAGLGVATLLALAGSAFVLRRRMS